MATLPPIAESKHKRIGWIAALLVLIILFIYLNLMTFLLADPPPKDIPVTATMELPKEIVLKQLELVGGGSGKPTNAPKANTNPPQSEKIITREKSNTKERTGKSNHNTQEHNATNEAATTQVSENPFGPGGSGGGDQGGDGHGFGRDKGDGIGPGSNGGKKPRVMIKKPNSSDIESDQSCKISFKVWVDARGNVVKAEYIAGQTTTVNQILINKVRELVIRDTKYNEVQGSSLDVLSVSLNLTAR